MEGYFADSPPEFKSCAPGSFSFFFDLVEQEFSDTFLNSGAIQRICSFMRKMGATHLAKEYLQKERELLEEEEDAAIRCGGAVAIKFKRFSFFYSPEEISTDAINLTDRTNKLFLGYVVIANLELPNFEKRSYVLEAVLHTPGRCQTNSDGTAEIKPVSSYYVHVHKVFKSCVGMAGSAQEFEIDGTFFCQQNDLTHVCANACLRMALNTSHLVSQKVTNRGLNSQIGIDHAAIQIGSYNPKGVTEQNIGSTGLSIDQIIEALRKYGLNPHLQFMPGIPVVDYAEYVYPFVESGIPVIISFRLTPQTGHVITLVGHTLNSDKWDCEAHVAYDPEAILAAYHASSTWVDHFLVNDDNFGMYSAMPLSHLRNPVMPKYDLTKRVHHVITLFPSNVNVIPYVAEVTAVTFIRNLLSSLRQLGPNSNRWLERLISQSQSASRRLVARTYYMTKLEYLEALQTPLEDIEGNILDDVTRNDVERILPLDFWVTEITLPDIYTANKRKLGDLLYTACDPTNQGQPELIWGWLPSMQFTNQGSPTQWPIRSHVSLFKTKLAADPKDGW